MGFRDRTSFLGDVAAATPISFSVATSSSGSNKALIAVFGMSVDGPGPEITACDFDGQAFTQVGGISTNNGGNRIRSEIWYLANPGNGVTANFSFTQDDPSGTICQVFEYDDIVFTNPPETASNNSNLDGSDISATLTPTFTPGVYITTGIYANGTLSRNAFDEFIQRYNNSYNGAGTVHMRVDELFDYSSSASPQTSTMEIGVALTRRRSMLMAFFEVVPPQITVEVFNIVPGTAVLVEDAQTGEDILKVGSASSSESVSYGGAVPRNVRIVGRNASGSPKYKRYEAFDQIGVNGLRHQMNQVIDTLAG